jgi:hypothetical protein
MMSDSLHPDMFPRFSKSVNARWAPLLLHPIVGSPECLVVGCAAVVRDDFHLELVNSLDRLNCFYGEQASVVRFAIELSVEALKHDLSKRGELALSNPYETLSGLKVGEVCDGEGESLAEIAQSWLGILSSLQSVQRKVLTLVQQPTNAVHQLGPDAKRVTLPKEIFQYVKIRNPQLAACFSESLRFGRRRSVVTRDGSEIDFSGKKLVANFARISLGQPTASRDRIKVRLWDLSAERDRTARQIDGRAHELIVQIPVAQAAYATAKQVKGARLAFENLEEAADKKQIIIRKFGSDDEIFKHIASVEMVS